MTFGNCMTTPTIEALNLRLFVPFFVDSDDPMTAFERLVGALTHTQLLANFPALPNVKDKILARCGDRQVWEPIRPAVADAFYPHIRTLLGGEMPALLRSYELSQTAYLLLDGGFGKTGKGLVWRPSASAKKRLGGACERVSVSFCRGTNKSDKPDKPRLHLFGLGCGLLEVSLSVCESCDFGLVKEFVYDFSRAKNKIAWAEDESESFLLKDIIGGLLGQNAGQSAVGLSGLNNLRYFSYVAVRCAGVVESETLGKMAFGLAHRQTEDYYPVLETFKKSIYQPFDNISHATSLEGGATVLCVADTSLGSEHIETFINNVLKNTYIPMFMMSYFEFSYLVSLISRGSPNINLAQKDEAVIRQLEHIREQILTYRFYYRFIKVSQLSQHNDFYEHWRKTFDNDKIMQDLMENIHQISDYLTYALEKQNQALEKKQSKLIGALGIIATGALSMIGVFGTNFEVYKNLPILSPITALTLMTGMGAIGGAVAVYLFVLNKK